MAHRLLDWSAGAILHGDDDTSALPVKAREEAAYGAAPNTRWTRTQICTRRTSPARPPCSGRSTAMRVRGVMETGSPEWLATRIVEEMPDAVIFADREGAIRLWNRGAEAMFGYSAAEALGKSLDLIVPERHRSRHWEGYRHV